MGARFSKHPQGQKGPAAGEPVEAVVQVAAAGPVSLHLQVMATGHVQASLLVRRATTIIAEEDLFYRIQLQESFSPAQPVHLILLPTDKKAQGELSHVVGDWMVLGKGSQGSEGNEGEKPSSPGGRLLTKLSPRHKPKPRTPVVE